MPITPLCDTWERLSELVAADVAEVRLAGASGGRVSRFLATP